MTVRQLYDNALILMGASTSDTDYDTAAVACVNMLLADVFEINNVLLVDADSVALTTIPSISALTDNLPTDDRLNRGVLEYGLAMYLLMSEDHPSKNYFFSKYEEGKAKYSIATNVDIIENYSDVTGDE